MGVAFDIIKLVALQVERVRDVTGASDGPVGREIVVIIRRGADRDTVKRWDAGPGVRLTDTPAASGRAAAQGDPQRTEGNEQDAEAD